MRFPILTPGSSVRTGVTQFGGYRHTDAAGEGEYYTGENLSSVAYPALTTRPSRSRWQEMTHDNSLYGKLERTLAMASYGGDLLRVVESTGFVSLVRGRDTLLLDGLTMQEPKQLIVMGARAYVFPDGVYCNLEDPADRGEMGARLEILSYAQTQYRERLFLGFTFRPCTLDGSVYDISYDGGSAPEAPKAGEYWLDRSEQEPVLKQYDGGMWMVIPAAYTLVDLVRNADATLVNILSFRLTDWFSDGDVVRISGLAGLEAADRTLVRVSARSFLLQGLLPGTEGGQSADITLERRIPKMDLVIRGENRLWGCRYGEDLDGNRVNELYACKLGDPRNWYSYTGAAADSYAVTLGAEGPFTGAVFYDGCPVFFKARTMIRVRGGYPAAYTVSLQSLPGVHPGSEKSLVSDGGRLYYHSREGVCLYDGGSVRHISQALGRQVFRNAVGGVWEGRYYVCLEDSDGQARLFCYDPEREIWHREDAMRVIFMAPLEQDLLVMKEEADGGQYMVSLGGGIPAGFSDWKEGTEGPVSWEWVSGWLGGQLPDHRYLGRLGLRMRLGRGTKVQVSVQYDGGPFLPLRTLPAGPGQSYTLPVRIQRADRLRLRLQGTGPCTLLSLTKYLEEGSELP